MANEHDDHDDGKQIAAALREVANEIKQFRLQRETEFEWIRSHLGLATKLDLKETETKIMSAISDFAAKQNAFNDRQDAAVAGVTADVQFLKDEIIKLQNSPGPISPEDQASLDALQARAEAAVVKLEALDAATPPVPPTA